MCDSGQVLYLFGLKKWGPYTLSAWVIVRCECYNPRGPAPVLLPHIAPCDTAVLQLSAARLGALWHPQFPGPEPRRQQGPRSHGLNGGIWAAVKISSVPRPTLPNTRAVSLFQGLSGHLDSLLSKDRVGFQDPFHGWKLRLAPRGRA